MQQLVGPHFNVQTMRDAQQWALAQLANIAAEFTPGMLETDAQTLLCQRLAQAGVDTHWHPAIVRFGANTCKIYSESSDPTVRLGENDVFFIDIGPVWQGHEADVGATYAVGHDVDAKAIVQAVDQVFAKVEAHWRGGCSGTELYQYAQHCAQQLGYQLHHQIKGHRVGDYPHKLYASGSLGELAGEAVPGIWVLEIQLRHPTLAIGAFKEQVLF